MKNLQAARKAANMTQVQLAEASGVTQETISAYENGVHNPTLTNLIKLKKALNEHPEGSDSITIEYLIGGELEA